MKRLITILVLFTGFVPFIIGQTGTLPMAVVGDVYVSASGSLRSKGDVHVRTANPDSLRGIIDNYGNLAFNEGLILYSNDSTDGLFKNNNASSSGVTAQKVVVRKSFAKTTANNSNKRYYYTFSFPFKVSLLSKMYGSDKNGTRDATSGSKVCISSTGVEAELWTDYEVAFYDSHKRAFETHKPEGNWSWFNEDDTEFGTTYAAYLKKGVGYRIYSKAAPELDFVLTDATEIGTLLSYSDKTTSSLPYIKDPNYTTGDNTPSEGWDILGGLNTTSFLLQKDNVTYDDGGNQIVYYYNNKKPGWDDLYFGDTESVVLSPYVTFFVQTVKENQTFTFKKEGFSLNKATPGFRAAEVATKDMLRLTIAKENNPSLSDNAYVELIANSEDRVKGFKIFNNGDENAPASQYPSIYSLYNENFANAQTRESSAGSYELLLNRLPSADQEVKLGVVSPVDGRYTFSLNAIQRLSVKSALLHDIVENQYTDLLKDTYSCWINKGKVDDRFVLFVQTGALPIDKVANEQSAFAYANDNMLTVKGIQKGDQVRVLDLSGRIVASGVASSNEFSATLIQKGVYLVNVKGEKAAVLKVVNK